jgi:hypothetical protein
MPGGSLAATMATLELFPAAAKASSVPRRIFHTQLMYKLRFLLFERENCATHCRRRLVQPDIHPWDAIQNIFILFCRLKEPVNQRVVAESKAHVRFEYALIFKNVDGSIIRKEKPTLNVREARRCNILQRGIRSFIDRVMLCLYKYPWPLPNSPPELNSAAIATNFLADTIKAIVWPTASSWGDFDIERMSCGVELSAQLENFRRDCCRRVLHRRHFNISP